MPSFTPSSRRFVVSLTLALAVITAVMIGGRIKAEVESSVFFVPVLTATKADALVDGDADNKADPGETINYTVQVNNTGADPATGVTFSDTIDANTTLQGAFTAASAVAVNDTFPTTVLGNVSINSATITGGPYSVVTNDFLGVNPLSTISAFDAISANGGNVVMTTSGGAMGQFTYDPPAGFTGTDTFTYTLTDNASATSVIANRTATVSITVSGMVWFINNNASACTVAGCGRLSNPFSTLAAFNTLNNGTGNNPAAGDNIFVYESATTYTGGVTLLASQRFIGQDSQDTLSNITGLTPPTGSPAFPAMNLGGSATTITNGGGNGITLNEANLVRGMTVSGASASGIAGVAATNNATIAGNNDVTITGTTGVAAGNGALSFNGGNGTVTFSGTISGNTGDAVNIRNRTGGITTIQGPVTSITRGVVLDNNDGATILFTQGLSLSTGANAAFTAINGGTVNATQNNTSIVNTITTTSGIALNVANTTIGASNLTFRSISSNGASSGIILNGTGSSGGLTVTGNSAGNCGGVVTPNAVGTPATITAPVSADCTGGAILNSTSDGISLINATNVSLTRMRIQDSGDSGVFGNNLSGFSLISSWVESNGDTTVAEDSGLEFVVLTGTNNVTNSTISNSFEHSVNWQPTSGTATLNITGTTVGPNPVGSGANGVHMNNSTGTINMTLVITNSNIDGNQATGISPNAEGSSTYNLKVSNTTIKNNNIALNINSGTDADVNFNVVNNTIIDHNNFAIGLVPVSTSTTNSKWNGIITGNRIGDGSVDSGSRDAYGIRGDFRGDVDAIVSITSNTITNTDIEPIFVEGRLDNAAAGTPLLDITIRSNTLGVPDDNSAFPFGSIYGMRLESRDNFTVTADVALNNATGLGLFEDIRFRQRNASTFKMERLTDGDGTPNELITNLATVEAQMAADNPGNTVDATQETVATGYTELANGATRDPVIPGPIALMTNPFNSDSDTLALAETFCGFDDRSILLDASCESAFELFRPKLKVRISKSEASKPVNGSNATAALDGSVSIRDEVFASAQETGVWVSVREIANSLVSMIMPTASAQEVRVINGVKVAGPESGETVNIGPIATLPAGKSVTITFRVLVDALDSGEIRSRILNQGSADSNETSAVLTTDPSPSVDPACTAAPPVGNFTCTPVDRPDTTITTINRVTTSPTNAASVQWTITFADAVAGLTASNLTLTDTTTSCSGESLGTITPVGGSPATAWTVDANTGTGSCTLRLDVANDGGLSHDVTNAPFTTGQTIVVDKLAPSTTSFVRFSPATSPTNADTLVFRATFSEDLANVDTGDFAVSGGTTAMVTNIAPVTGTSVYDVTISGGDLAGVNATVGLNLNSGGNLTDLAGNTLPLAEPATDETYTLDNAPPTVTINQAGGQLDPTNTSPISFTVAFNEAVTDFDDLTDVTLTGTATATVTSITPAGGNTFTVVVTPTTNGTVIANIGSGVAIDGAGNPNDAATFTDNQVTYDTAAPTVTINQAIGQSDPTFANPINFTAIFNEPVTDFDDAADVAVTGTAAGVGTATVVITPNSTTNYTVAISGITGDGTVIANIPSGVAIDAATNSNDAATFTDNTVTFVTCVAPPPNMIGWWAWDGNGADIANGNTATLVGAPTFPAGKVNQAIQLNGSTQFANTTSVVNAGAAGAFTVDAWINPNNVTTAQPLIEWNNGSGGGFGQGIGVHFWLAVAQAGGGPGSLYANVRQNGFDHPVSSAQNLVIPGQWQHVAMSYDGANFGKTRLYLNGVIVADVNVSAFTPDTNMTLYFGRRPAPAVFSFGGAMDEVEVFNRALTPAEIQSIFAADGGGKCKPSDLRVDKSHVGNFTQGTAGSYSVSVINDGPAATSGTTTMTDTLPAGLTPGAATGTNWSCNTVTQTVTCTSTDAIAAAGTFPAITIPVTVAQNSALSLNNTATVSGGGEMDTSDDSDTDPTTIVGVAQTPSVTDSSTVHGAQTTSGLVITPNATDGAEVTHYKITNILNGSLFQNDGTTPITAGSFITVAQGGAGLKFTPNLGFVGNATFDIQASISNNDAGLGGSVITATIMVAKANTTTTITSDNPEPSVFGENVVVNFTVAPVAPGTGVPTGNVVVTVSGGAETCTGTAAAGTCTLALTTVGARTLTATYAGDTFFNGSNDTEAHQVDQAATTTTITTDNPDPSVTGEQVTVVFTVTANSPGAGTPTGNVNVTVSGGAETCTGTVAVGNCIITLNSVGAPRTLTATYGGDTNFTGSSDTEDHTVTQAATTTTTVSDLPDASVVGEPVAVTFTVVANPPGSGTPTGNVVVTVSGGAETCTGTVASGTCNITLTSAGSRTLTATYQGDSNFLTSFDTEPHTVNQASTTITGITDAPDPSNIDQPYTVGFTLNVTAPGAGTPTGTVSVNDGTGDSCTATLPATSCQLQSLTQGVKTITVTYNGDANFATSSNTAGHQVLCTPNPVVTNSNDSGPGSLRKAVADACAGDTITFAPGPIPGDEKASRAPSVTSPISLSGGQITLDKNVIIQGPGASLLTVQNTAAASATSRIFSVNGGVTATISGLTLTGGNPTSDGGAIRNLGTLTVNNSVFTLNSAGGNGGGGIANEGTLNVNNSTFFNNNGGFYGGGLLMINGGTMNVTGSTFNGNQATNGGGIGIQALAAPAVATLTIHNSTISGNTTTNSSPGIGNYAAAGGISTAAVTSCTITGNAGPLGSGLASGNNGGVGTAVSFTVRNSIVANNTGSAQINGYGGATTTSQGYNLISDASLTPAIADQLNTDPMITPLANNGGPTQAHALLASSPAVDKGDDGSVAATTDQRGELRPFDLPSITPAAGGDNSDIGAYELNTIPTTTTVTSNSNPSVFGQSVTFTATVATVPPGGSVTGNIDFSFDGNPVAACQDVVLVMNQATCSTSTLSVGSHTIFAEFDEDLPFLASSGTLTQNVNKANTSTTVTAVPASPSVFGQSVTFTATVAAAPPGAGTPTGTVTFNIDGNIYCANTPLNGSQQASCTQAGLPALPAGVRNVVAIYNGDVNFNGSSGTLNYTVNKANTTTAITNDSPDPSLVNQPYPVTWTVDPDPVYPGSTTPTGTVTVNGGAGGGSCTAAVAAGGCQLTPTTTGTKTLTATYNGDANFNTSTSSSITHTVNVQITGTVRLAPAMTPISGLTMTVSGCMSGTATTDSSGVYTISFGGVLGSVCTITPPAGLFDPTSRTYTVNDNITGADFTAYNSLADVPRTLTLPTQYIVPGAAGTMPVILNSQDNEAQVAFTITYDINPFAQPPTFVCGSNAPLCTIVMDTSILGRVGVTVTPAGGAFSLADGQRGEAPQAPGPKEIARMNFQTLANNLPSTPIDFVNTPVNTIARDASNNPLLVNAINGLIVFAQGNESDVSTRNAGNGSVDSTDVVQLRRFVTGLDTPVANFNEFQRADTSPAASRGNGQIDATDVVQTRRYATGLDSPQAAGGPGATNPGPIAPPEREAAAAGSREVRIGNSNASTNSRVTVPVEIIANGEEMATSFTLRYDHTKLANPRVETANTPEGATLTSNTAEPGVISVLIDGTTPFARSKDAQTILNIAFDVSQKAPTGDTTIELESVVISDAAANSLASRTTNGRISIAGPNALGVEISGRVMTPTGQGLRNATVTVTNAKGQVRSASTGTFGYYRFEGLVPGETYTVSVVSRRYRFEARRLTSTENPTAIDFTAME